MSNFVFPPEPVHALSIEGQSAQYAVRRIFCVGRNYAAHASEMGSEVDREAPWYFLKSPMGLIQGAETAPYALATENYHHEVELVFAMGADAFEIAPEAAEDLVYAYGVGLDMTRRDLQEHSKSKRRPWDTGKDVEGGAIFGPLALASKVSLSGDAAITLHNQGALRQSGHLKDMVWSVPEIISHLSYLYHLGPGDVVMTGTPAGVGPVNRGDALEGRIDGLPPLSITIV